MAFNSVGSTVQPVLKRPSNTSGRLEGSLNARFSPSTERRFRPPAGWPMSMPPGKPAITSACSVSAQPDTPVLSSWPRCTCCQVSSRLTSFVSQFSSSWGSPLQYQKFCNAPKVLTHACAAALTSTTRPLPLPRPRLTTRTASSFLRRLSSTGYSSTVVQLSSLPMASPLRKTSYSFTAVRRSRADPASGALRVCR